MCASSPVVPGTTGLAAGPYVSSDKFMSAPGDHVMMSSAAYFQVVGVRMQLPVRVASSGLSPPAIQGVAGRGGCPGILRGLAVEGETFDNPLGPAHPPCSHRARPYADLV